MGNLQGRVSEKKCHDLMPTLSLDDSVGPAAYIVKSEFDGPKFSFARADRFPETKSVNGVCSCVTAYGSFNPEEFRKVWTDFFGFSLDSACVSDSPGPGQYKLPSTLSTTGVTIKGKPVEPVCKDSPGPGSYNVQQTFKPKFPVITERKMKQRIGLTASVDFIYNDFISEGPSYSFGRKPKSPLRIISPGPAEYLIQSPRSVGFSFSGKAVEQKSFITPGPGYYNTTYPKSITSCDVFQVNSNALRFEAKHNDMLNNLILQTGSYSPEKHYKCSAFYFSREKRFKSIDVSPGPGEFYREEQIGGPKYSMPGRNFQEVRRSKQPGPGSYDMPSTLINGRITIKGKWVDVRDDNFPGPGAYSIESFSTNNGFSIGKSERFDTSTNNVNERCNSFNSLSVESVSSNKICKGKKGNSISFEIRPKSSASFASCSGLNPEARKILLEFQSNSSVSGQKTPDSLIKPFFTRKNPPRPISSNPSGFVSILNKNSDTPTFHRLCSTPGPYRPSPLNKKVVSTFSKSKRMPDFKVDTCAGFYNTRSKPSGPSFSIQGKPKAYIRPRTPIRAAQIKPTPLPLKNSQAKFSSLTSFKTL